MFILSLIFCLFEQTAFGQYGVREEDFVASYKKANVALKISGAITCLAGTGSVIWGIVAAKQTETMVSIYDKQLDQPVGVCSYDMVSELIYAWEKEHPKENYTYVHYTSPLYPYSQSQFKEYKASTVIPLIVGPVLVLTGGVMWFLGDKGEVGKKKYKLEKAKRELELSYLPGGFVLKF